MKKENCGNGRTLIEKKRRKVIKRVRKRRTVEREGDWLKRKEGKL